MKRAALLWAIGFAVLFGAFAATVGILGGTIYSAHGFVESYLAALARHDATTARELSGVRAPAGTASDLLTDGSIGTISHIHLVSDESASSGIHTVTYSYELGAAKHETDFRVRATGAFLGLFPQWTFSTSPLATVSVTVLHDNRFRANGTAVTSTAKAGAAAAYEVFTPGLYSFDHRSAYLVAAPVGVPITETESVTPVQVDVQANKAFVSAVSTELGTYLDTCATQKVLLPTSCPFGKSFNNRVISTPTWSIKHDPEIAITPSTKEGLWLVPSTVGVAHLKVKVQSLFDGTLSSFNGDVDFTVAYSIAIGANGHLTITALR